MSNIYKFQLQSQFQRFLIPNFVCVLTSERYKTYQNGINILSPRSCPRGVTLGRLGCPGGHVFEHGHVAYQIDEQNRMKVNFSPLGQSGDLGVRGQKVNFKLQSQFQRILYISLCVFSQIKDRNIMNGIFTLLPGTCSRGGTLGCWGGGRSKTLACGFAMAPHRLRVLI